MDFKAFDTKKIDAYARQAKASWGQTAEYREYERKSAGRTKEEEQRLGTEMMGIFARFGGLLDQDPAGEAAQALVVELQAFISEHYYACSNEMLRRLGLMYAGGGSLTEGIDRAGGPGTAEYAHRAIECYCGVK